MTKISVNLISYFFVTKINGTIGILVEDRQNLGVSTIELIDWDPYVITYFLERSYEQIKKIVSFDDLDSWFFGLKRYIWDV